MNDDKPKKPRRQLTFKQRVASIDKKIEHHQKRLASAMAAKQRLLAQARDMKAQLEEALGG